MKVCECKLSYLSIWGKQHINKKGIHLVQFVDSVYFWPQLHNDYIETAGLRQNPKWSISHLQWLLGSWDQSICDKFAVVTVVTFVFVESSSAIPFLTLYSLTPSHKMRVNFIYNLTAVFLHITIIKCYSLLLCKWLVTRFDTLRHIIYIMPYENHLPYRGFGADGLKLWAIYSWVKTDEVAKWAFCDQ
jgi:hypothetical protein